eukprot:1145447-Pelagomonas_calceolata.AAC.7
MQGAMPGQERIWSSSQAVNDQFSDFFIPASIQVSAWSRTSSLCTSQCWACAQKEKKKKRKKRKEKKNYVGRGNSPYINEGKGDTLSQKIHETPPPQSCKTESVNGDLEGY